MNVTEVVAAVASLGNDFQSQQETIGVMNSLLGILCDDRLKKYIHKIGIQRFMETIKSGAGDFERARFSKPEDLEEPKEPKEPDGNSLP